MQLEPHFLFNALNAISSQVVNDAKLARDMIEDLGALLRLSLEFRNSHEISLAEELALLEHYLAIQKVRFGSRLRISSCIAPEVRFASVPSLLIQPLVENAINHGISSRASGGTITISAQRVGDEVEIHVMDDGIGLPVGWQIETSAGIGLTVTRERLIGLYPNGTSRFDVKRREDAGTDVVVTLPMREIGKGANEPVPV
jgi:LytS/YehU family sensor histidine kinase